MSRILITGASGFIGTNLLEYFVEKGHYVINIDFNEPKIDERKALWKNIDITDEQRTVEAIAGFDPEYIVHLAARTDLFGNSFKDYDANITGVRNVLKAVENCQNLKKILITSSMLVCSAGYMPKNQRDYCPPNWYGKSKVETENIVWENQPKCDWAILRPTSMWGAWFDEPYRKFFDMVRRRMYFHLGHTSCTKTYGYIENAVYQIEQIMLNPTVEESNKVFYLGDNPPIFIEEWANQIADALGHRRPIRVPLWMIWPVAKVGDILKNHLHIFFPLTTFRIRNMSTNNIINLDNTYAIAPNPPVDRIEGIRRTLEWINRRKQ